MMKFKKINNQLNHILAFVWTQSLFCPVESNEEGTIIILGLLSFNL